MAKDMDKKANISFEGQSLDFPIYSPTLGPDVIDISKLYGTGDVFTYDPGFTSTASCESAITYIDGAKGELLYRGYPIDQLAEKSHFLEVCYLLLQWPSFAVFRVRCPPSIMTAPIFPILGSAKLLRSG